MKRSYRFAMVASGLVGSLAGAGLASAQSTDVWGAATTAATTAGTNVSTLVIALIVIPVTILGFRVAKRVLNKG